ncbi:hypothetical protein AB3N60_04300 [Leptospira sp. WS39.C2]
MKAILLLSCFLLLQCMETNKINQKILSELNEKNIIGYFIRNQKLTRTEPYKIYEFKVINLLQPNRSLISGKISTSPLFELDVIYFILITERENHSHKVLFSFLKDSVKGLNFEFLNLNNDTYDELLLYYDLSGNGYTETYSEIYEGISYQKVFETPMEYSAKDTLFKNQLSFQNGKNSFKDIFLYSKFKTKTCNVFTAEGCGKFSSHIFRYTKQLDEYTLKDQKDRDLYYGIFQDD